MNKKAFWILLLLTLILTACAANPDETPVFVSRDEPSATPNAATGGGQLASTPDTAPADSAAPTAGASSIELPTQTRLILGVIKLEETENAITAEQATTLLPMFYVLKGLNDSDTTAQEEIDGLLKQIQATLHAEQIQAIENMAFSSQDVLAFAQAKREDSRGGNGPGVPGGPPKEGEPDRLPGSEQSAAGTPTAGDQANGLPALETETPSALFDAVIALLQGKTQ